MIKILSDLAQGAANLLFPLHCQACKKPIEPSNALYVCQACVMQIRRNPKPHCTSCGRGVDRAGTLCAACKKTRPHFGRAHSACLYEGALKEIVHSFKYKERIRLSKILSNLMIDFAKDNLDILDGIDAVTFVPAHKNIFKNRAFNQARLLAENISMEFGIPLMNTIEKTISTRHQNDLSRDERLVNLKGSFTLKNGSRIDKMKLLLVDDIMTTGATLDECSKTLLKGGAEKISCFTLARGT